MPEHTDMHIGSRLREIRKRRGMSQKDLCEAAGLSISLVRKLEQGEKQDVRLETAHQLAQALDVSTSQLLSGEPSMWSPPVSESVWRPVVNALETLPVAPSEQPTEAGVAGSLEGGRLLFASEQYADLGAILPSLLRDVAALDDGPKARKLHYEAMQLCVSFLGQVRQYAAAADAAERAMDAAVDELAGGAAVVAQCQQLLRQGKLTEAAELADRWATAVEPRISNARPEELAVWGGLMLRVGAAAVRDNRKGEAAHALRMAKIAAVGLGREVITGPDHLRHFGPVTVTQQHAEHAAIQRRPEQVLSLHQAIRTWRPVKGGGRSGRCRHLLDVADAHLRMRDESSCVDILHEIHQEAPQWIVAQRYAHDIMGRVVERRRSLTPEMRGLADAIGVPL